MSYGHTTIYSYVILTLRMLSASPQLTKHPATPSSNTSTCHYLSSMTSRTVPFYGQLIFPAGTRYISLLHSIPTQPNSYSLGSFLMDNTAGEWSWPLIPSGLKVKNVWSHISTLSQAFMAWHLFTNRKKFTFSIQNITVAEQKGSTLLLLLSRNQNVKIVRNYTDTKQARFRTRWLDVTSSWQSYYTQGTSTCGGSLTMVWQESMAPSDRRLLSRSQKATCSNSE